MLGKKVELTPKEILEEITKKTEEGMRHFKIIKNYLEWKLGRAVDFDDVIKWFKKTYFERKLFFKREKDIRILSFTRVLGGSGDFDMATYYGKHYIENYSVKVAERTGLSVERIYGDEFIPETFYSKLEKFNPVFLSVCGHGNGTTFTGQNEVEMIKVGDEERAKAWSGRVVNFLSCSIGQELVPWLVEKGLKSAMAYDDVYYFMADPTNFPNSYAFWFFNAHFTFDVNLYKGCTVREAHQLTLDKYQENIEKAPEECKPYLHHDMIHCKTYGDRNVRIVQLALLKLSIIDSKDTVKDVFEGKVPVNVDVEIPITVPLMTEGNGIFRGYANFRELEDTTDVEIKLKKPSVKFDVVVLKPEKGEELVMTKDYTARVRVEYAEE